MKTLKDIPSLFSLVKFSVSSHNPASDSYIAGILHSSQIKNDNQSLGNFKVIQSNLQNKSVSRKSGKSSKSDRGKPEVSCGVPAHLLTLLRSTGKLNCMMHDGTMQHYFSYDQAARITSSTDYPHPNERLNFDEENKKNSKH